MAKRTPEQRAATAIKFFANPAQTGPWIMGLLEAGADACDDGRCDPLSENPTEARHARAISEKEYIESSLRGFIAYLQTRAGAEEFDSIISRSYEDLTQDSDD